MLFAMLTLIRLEKLRVPSSSSGLCLWPSYKSGNAGVRGEMRMLRLWSLQAACPRDGMRQHLPGQYGQSHPWWGNSFGVHSPWEASLQPTVERVCCSRPCALPFGTDLTFCFLCLQVAGDADSLSEDKQAESEEEEEGGAPDSPGNPRGSHAVAWSLASLSGPQHCAPPGKRSPQTSRTGGLPAP